MFAYVDGNDDRFPSRFFNAAVLVTMTCDCINDIAPMQQQPAAVLLILTMPGVAHPRNERVGCRYSSTRSSAIAEGPRDATCQLQSCQLPRNSAETTRTTRPEPSISCR